MPTRIIGEDDYRVKVYLGRNYIPRTLKKHIYIHVTELSTHYSVRIPAQAKVIAVCFML